MDGRADCLANQSNNPPLDGHRSSGVMTEDKCRLR